MRGELEALLSLQESDLRIAELERQIEGLSPRLRDLERKKGERTEALGRAEAAVKMEERRLHELQRRIAAHSQLQDRNVAQMDVVRNVREAGAATTQLDVTRRIIAEDEVEMRGTQERITALQAEVDRIRGEVEEMSLEIELAHSEVAERHAELQAELESARSERSGRADQVSRPMLGKYDRIRGRRPSALHPIRGQSCGHCDTAVPLHRRSEMQASGGIEVCEACGVLLYIGPAA